VEQDARQVLAAAIVEALETGNPIAPLPPELRPADPAQGEAVAEEVLDMLGLAPCGIRLLRMAEGGWVAGPMLETRLLRDGATLATGALRHPRVSAAIIGVLAEPLDPEGTGAPRLAAVHAALDVAGSRFRDGAVGLAESVADLADLGFVVAGRRAAPAGATAASCAIEPKRPRGLSIDLTALFAEAAAAARRLGGLPAGALLVVAGLSPVASPGPGQDWTARIVGLGRARIRIAEAAGPT
jgi:2-keto-4-pentenoate hydratase